MNTNTTTNGKRGAPAPFSEKHIQTKHALTPDVRQKNAPLDLSNKSDSDAGNPPHRFDVSVNIVESSTRLCKRITLSEDGKTARIEGSVQPYQGNFSTARVSTMHELAQLLVRFRDNQALNCSNTTFEKPTPFTTKDDLSADKIAAGWVARDKDNLKWLPGQALFPLDHDDKGTSHLSLDEFQSALALVFPAFSKAAQLVTWSSSSCIYNKTTEAELRGAGSFHAYCVISDGSDLTRFVDVLQKRLWLNGYGHIWIDKIGKQHVRSIIDGAIYGAQGLMYEAPPELGDELEQRRPPPTVVEGLVLDTSELKDLTDDETSQYAALVDQAKQNTKGAAKKVAKAYVSVEVEKLIARGIAEKDARTAVTSRLNGNVTTDDYLYFDHLSEPICVADVLSNLDEFDGKTLADPREPDYMGTAGVVSKGKAKFYANVDTGIPVIHSFAHGGLVYKLPPPPRGNDDDDGDAPPRPEVDESWLQRMNYDYAVIDNCGAVYVMGTGGKCPAIYTTQALHLKFQNQRVLAGYKRGGQPIIKTLDQAWLEHRKRREYAGLTFDTSASPPPNKFNLWQGFGIKPVAGTWEKMRWHLLNVICEGDEKRFEYALKYIAWVVQNPGKRAEVAFVMLSREEGTGKGTLMRWIGDIFGPAHYRKIESVNHILGNFNEILLGSCLVFLDEALFAGNPQHANRLKGMITEPTITIEGKFKARMSVDNNITYFMASNEDWAVPAGPTARRYFITQVSPSKRGDTTYFNALEAERSAGGPAAMFDSLLKMDLGDWMPRHDVPKTDALYQQKRQSMSLLEQWIVNQVEDDAFHDCFATLNSYSPTLKSECMQMWESGSIQIDRGMCDSAFVDWVQKRRGGLAHRVATRDDMGRALRTMLGATAYRPRGPNGKLAPRQWQLPPLADARINLDKYLHDQR